MNKWWQNYPWRVIQSNFREIDTLQFDEDRFLNELKSFSCNAVMLNAAGLIASYPSKLSDHTVSPYLDGFDLKHLVDRCHENGIRVIARTDFSKIPESVYLRHPDWVYRHADGTPLIYNGYVQTCLLGGYQGGYMDEIIREMFDLFPFDGIYCNMGSATGYVVDYSMKRHGPCQCENCKKAFTAKTGMPVPTDLRPGDPVSMQYFGWQQGIAAAQKKRVTAVLRSISPDIAYCSIDYVRQEAYVDFASELPKWTYQASSAARMMRGMDAEATVANVDFLGFPYRRTSCDSALQELRLWQTLSNFGGIDYYVMGRLYDKPDQSTFPRVKRIFSYAKEHEDLMYGVKSAANILLVRDSYIMPNKEERGWVRMLTENHFLFDETLGGGLLKKDLSAYKAVILPEKMRLSPQQAELLDAYAKNGGIVITSGKATASLQCLGIKNRLPENKKAEGAVFHFDEKTTSLFPAFADRPYLIAGFDYLPMIFAPGVETYGNYCPPQPFGPPELCYDKEPETSFPAASRAPFGSGYGICLPWYPGTNYYTDGHESWRLFVRDLLKNLCGVQPVGYLLCPMTEVTYGKKGDTGVLHFTNASGHFGNSYFDPPRLTEQSVRIPWPHDTAHCENLDEPGNVEWQLENGTLLVTLPSLGFHACVVITQ